MSAEPDLDVSIVVIAYNSEGRIGQAVRAHEEALADRPGEVIVIDNASADRGADEARAALTRGRVIRNDTNLGYGKAANQGILAARGRACIIMNDDARLGPDDVSVLLDVLDSDERIGLVGPRIIDESGRPMPSARRTFPGPAEEFERVKELLLGEEGGLEYPPTDNEPTDVAWLVGACIAGRTNVLREVGGFNPSYFLYVEDIDLAKRLSVLGFRVVTVPAATCVHTGSVSTTQAYGDQSRVERRAAARDVFYRTWYRRPTRMAIHLRRSLGLQHQPWRLRHHLPKVFWDGRSTPQDRFPPALNQDPGIDAPSRPAR